MGDVITIGIAGGTGSGKTTITRRIMQEFGGDVSVVYHDNYYKRHDDLTYEERTKLNYDHPNAFDGNFGGTAGVCEMLIQSDGNTISLLPALPKEWKDGNVSGIRARGGYEIAMKWNDSKVTELTIS